jgi:D-3-phosphoglycerate dehydrogenase / 2-oxoglutarate reductase
MKILANDGIDAIGKAKLEEAGFTIITEKVSQDMLAETLHQEGYIWCEAQLPHAKN